VKPLCPFVVKKEIVKTNQFSHLAGIVILLTQVSVYQLKNRWKNVKVILYRNGKKPERISGDLLVFKTKPDETIKISESR
jgi:hypothetical protein